MKKLWGCLLVLLLLISSVGASLNTPVWAAAAPPVSMERSPNPEPAIDETLPAANKNLSAGDISSEKVSQFIHAYLQVLRLVEQREGALQSAETQPEAQQLEREIEAEALAMIAAAGLTRQEYIQLLGLANSDPEFSERIAAQLQEVD